MKNYSKNHILHILLLFLAAPALNAEQCNVTSRYIIQAELIPSIDMVSARETLEWKNVSKDVIYSLQFHLYANAFKDENSTFMRESGSLLRRFMGVGNDDDYGWIKIKKIQMKNGLSLLDSIRYIQPDDNNEDDQTVIEIKLPSPLRPGRSISLDIQFELKVPKTSARIGRHKNYYLISQWFPKLGVYQPRGSRYPDRGYWNCHQYHATGEFFADFSSYDVTITVPESYVVGATGREIHKNISDSKATYRYFQDCVHDFAWTADPDFIEINSLFSASKEVGQNELNYYANLFGLPASDIRLNDVKIRLLIQPYKKHLADRYIEATKTAIKFFGLWFGSYPYDNVTVVDPAFGAGSTSGMEYPTFFTGGSPYIPVDKVLNPELVTIHEYGHNYWYGLVANNEFEESWLDEGINSYSEGKIADRVYGPNYQYLRISGIPLTRFFPHIKLRSMEMSRLAHQIAPHKDRIVKDSWNFSDVVAYFINSYERPSLYLNSLERILGEKTFLKILRTFQQQYRYKHPTTRDFIDLAEEISAIDLDPFFDQLFYDVKEMDYAVTKVTSKKIKTTKKVRHSEGTDSATSKEYEDKYRSEVVVSRNGEVVLPVELKVVFENGEELSETWEGAQSWKKFEYEKPVKIKYAVIDPEFKYTFDVNRCNNSRKLHASSAATIKVNTQLLHIIQQLILLLSSIT